MMEVEFLLESEDLGAFHRFHISERTNAAEGRSPILQVLFVVVAAIAYYALAQFIGPDRYLLAVGLFCLFFILAILGLALYLKAKVEFGSTKTDLRQSEKSLRTRIRLRIDTAGVSQATRFGYSTNFWNSVEGVFATDDHLFIYLGPETGYVVPRRAFAGLAFSEFVAQAKNYHATEKTVESMELAELPASEGVKAQENRVVGEKVGIADFRIGGE